MREVLGEFLGGLALLLTPWRTLMFTLALIQVMLVAVVISLANIVATQSTIMTQQQMLIAHIRYIEAIDEHLLASLNDTNGRSYLDGRPAVEIDRSPESVDSHRPRAP